MRGLTDDTHTSGPGINHSRFMIGVAKNRNKIRASKTGVTLKTIEVRLIGSYLGIKCINSPISHSLKID